MSEVRSVATLGYLIRTTKRVAICSSVSVCRLWMSEEAIQSVPSSENRVGGDRGILWPDHIMIRLNNSSGVKPSAFAMMGNSAA